MSDAPNTNPVADTDNLSVSIEKLIQDDIFVLMDMQDAEQEKKDKLIQNMVEVVNNRVLARVLDILAERNQEGEFQQLLDQDSDNDAIKAYLSKQQIPLDEIVAQETLVFKMEVVNLMKTGAPYVNTAKPQLA